MSIHLPPDNQSPDIPTAAPSSRKRKHEEAKTKRVGTERLSREDYSPEKNQERWTL